MAGKHFLITGASSGIGRATALRLARRGHVVHAGVRSREDGEQLVAAGDGELRPVRLDVTDSAEIKLAAEEIGDVPLAGLVNNAGIAAGGPLEVLDLEELRKVLEINLIGAVAVSQVFLGAVRKGKGRIVNVTSIGGRVATPFMGPYVASKFGLEALTDAMRMELRPWGIDVIAVEPGSVDTGIWSKGNEQIDQMLANLGEDGKRLYADSLEGMKGALTSTADRGIKPDRAARVIERALTARHPRARYLVGADARGMLTLRKLLPARLADRLYLRGLGLPG